MLTATIEKYLGLFAAASATRDTSLTLKLVEQMRQEFHSEPATVIEITEGLKRIATEGKPPGAEFVLHAAWGVLSPEYTPLLCRILVDERSQALHEPVIELLQEIADERAIPSLIRALDFRWGYDQWLLVPRKALQALAAIRTPEALRIIETAALSPIDLIRQEATSLIEDG